MCYLFALLLIENNTQFLYRIQYSFIHIASTDTKRQMQVQIFIPWCDAANLKMFLVTFKKLIRFQIRHLRFDHVLITSINETVILPRAGFGP